MAAGRQGGACEPGRGGWLAGQDVPVGGQAGVDAAEHLHRRLGPGGGLHELGLGQEGLGAGVRVAVMRGIGAVPDMPARGAEISLAQRDHAEDRVRERAVDAGAECIGDVQRGLGFGARVIGPAHRQVHPGPQDRRDGLGYAGAQRAHAVGRGVDDRLGLAELAKVDEPGGQREQRLEMPGVGRDPARSPRGLAGEMQSLVKTAAFPAHHGEYAQRPGQRRFAVLPGCGQDVLGQAARAGVFAERGQRLKLRDDDLVAPRAGQVRPAQECSGLGKCLEGLALQAQDRCQGAVQLRVAGRRLRLG